MAVETKDKVITVESLKSVYDSVQGQFNTMQDQYDSMQESIAQNKDETKNYIDDVARAKSLVQIIRWETDD